METPVKAIMGQVRPRYTPSCWEQTKVMPLSIWRETVGSPAMKVPAKT